MVSVKSAYYLPFVLHLFHGYFPVHAVLGHILFLFQTYSDINRISGSYSNC